MKNCKPMKGHKESWGGQREGIRYKAGNGDDNDI